MNNANPGVEKSYALDFLSVVRHVATELGGAASAALSVSDMASTYRHSVPTDLSRVRHHHDIGSDSEAISFLIERAVTALTHRGKTERSKLQIDSDGNGGYSLAVPFDDLEYDGDRVHRFTETDDEDEERALRAVYNDLANERVFYVTAQGERGAPKERQYKLHPLARAIPQIPFEVPKKRKDKETTFLSLAADIKQHGIRLPIHVCGDQVLDGRHRVAIAAALHVPVRVIEHDVDEEEALALVRSLNLERRNLTIAQRGLIVLEMYLPEAEQKARERKSQAGENHGRGKDRLAPTGAHLSDDKDAGRKAVEEAATQSQGLASVRTLQRMLPVRDAPKTKERIRSGEIKSGEVARREAETERGIKPTKAPVAQPRSGWDRLGCARGDVESAADSIESGHRGDVSADRLRERIDEIRTHLDRAESFLD